MTRRFCTRRERRSALGARNQASEKPVFTSRWTVFENTGRYFVTYQIVTPKIDSGAGFPLFRKGSAGIPIQQRLWNIESLENLSQIVPKEDLTIES